MQWLVKKTLPGYFQRFFEVIVDSFKGYLRILSADFFEVKNNLKNRLNLRKINNFQGYPPP